MRYRTSYGKPIHQCRTKGAKEMLRTYLSRHKESSLLFCLLAALIFSPEAFAGGMPDGTRGKQNNVPTNRDTSEPDQECSPTITRDEDGTIHVKGGRGPKGDAKCRERQAVNGDRGFCKAAPNRSFVCRTEGMVGCDTTKADGGTCRTIDTGGGICDCVCK